MTPEGEIQAYLKKRVEALGGQFRKMEWTGRRGAPGPQTSPLSFIGNGHDKILHTVSGDGETDAGKGYLCDGSDGLHARRDG